jgi:polyribonucleotide nucleotidyltransferase
VRVDSSRPADRSEPSKLKFRGSVDGVKAAVAQVSAIIERERKVEQVLKVETQHVGLLLGKGGATINNIQSQSGAVLDVAKRQAAGENGHKENGKDSSQAVTVRGNAAAVKKALALLEAVLQYNAECSDEVQVAPNMLPLLIGRGGEEINRIRLETGAAIDGERFDKDKRDEMPVLKLRGSTEAVAKAKALINASIEANKVVSESVVLPWHAIDALVGPNGDKLRQLESEHVVGVVLPGQDIASDQVGLGSGMISIATSMTLKGRKKCVDQATAFIDDLSVKCFTDETTLDEQVRAPASSHAGRACPGCKPRLQASVSREPPRARRTRVPAAPASHGVTCRPSRAAGRRVALDPLPGRGGSARRPRNQVGCDD